MITVATLATLMPYLVSAIYQLKLVITKQTYEQAPRAVFVDGLIAALALIYSLWVIRSGISDLKTLLFGLGLFTVGFIVHPFFTRLRQAESSRDQVKATVDTI